MNETNGSNNVGNIGFFGLLGIVFIVLKLCHVIDWPWIWVLSPFWVSILVAIGFFLIFFVGLFIVRWIVKRFK